MSPGRSGRPLRASWTGPLALHRPGRTVVHRAPGGAKLLSLLLLGVVVLVATGPLSSVLALAVVAGVAALARMPLRATLRGLVPVAAVALLLAAYQWWARGWAVGVEIAVDLVALVLAATVVTSTTRADALLDVVARAARPLRRVGVRPELVALTTGMVLRSVPVLLASTREARDAARARGLGRSPRAVLVPATVRMVGHGLRTGEALAARGLVDATPPDGTAPRAGSARRP